MSVSLPPYRYALHVRASSPYVFLSHAENMDFLKWALRVVKSTTKRDKPCMMQVLHPVCVGGSNHEFSELVFCINNQLFLEKRTQNERYRHRDVARIHSVFFLMLFFSWLPIFVCEVKYGFTNRPGGNRDHSRSFFNASWLRGNLLEKRIHENMEKIASWLTSGDKTPEAWLLDRSRIHRYLASCW